MLYSKEVVLVFWSVGYYRYAQEHWWQQILVNDLWKFREAVGVFLLENWKIVFGHNRKREHEGFRPGEPADGVTFFLFDNFWVSSGDFADIRRRHPVLVFVGDDVTADVKKFDDFYIYPMLLFHFPFECTLKRFTKFDTATGDFPFPPFIFCFFTP